MSATALRMKDRLDRIDRLTPDPDPLKRFSFSRALAMAIDESQLDGAEAEGSRELERRIGRPAGDWCPRGVGDTGVRFFAPLTAFVERRDLTVTTGTGATLVGINQDQVIDMIRARSIVLSRGAMVLDTLKGRSFTVPRVTTGVSVYWTTEGNSPTEAAPGVGTVSLVPHTAASFIDVTRSLQSQSGQAAARIVQRDIMRGFAAELDRVALSGSGSGGEPEGLLANADVPTVAIGTNGGPMTRTVAIAMEKTIDLASNDHGPLTFVTTPAAKASMRSIELSAGSGKYLYSDEDTVLSSAAFASTALPSTLVKGASGAVCSAAILGAFQDLVVGNWGGIEVIVDRYSFATSGGLRIIAHWDVDARPRKPESFVKVVDITTS